MKLEIEKMYQKSLKLKDEEKVDSLKNLLVICEDTEEHSYGYAIRFQLFKEYRAIGKLYNAIKLYMANIQVFLEHRYTIKPLLDNFAWVATYIDSVRNIQQKEINDFFNNMKNVYEISGFSLRSFYHEYYNYLMRIGKWEEGFTTYSRWMVESRDEASQSIGKEESDRAFYYFNVGDYDNGKYVFESVKKGFDCPSGTRTYAYARAVKYYFELKDWEMTSYLMQRGYDFAKYKQGATEEVAEIMKSLTILNPKIALKVWEKHRYEVNKSENERTKFSFGVSSYLLEKSLGAHLVGTKKLHKINECVKEMYDIQKFMDERNGTSAYHDELAYWGEVWDNFNKRTKKLKQQKKSS
ncbi:hypothetical protein [Priestia aryabhattai]